MARCSPSTGRTATSVRGSGATPRPLLLHRPGASALDTLGLWPALEKAAVRVHAGWLRVPVIFGRDVLAAGAAGRAVIGSTDSVRIAVYSVDGRPSLVLRGEATGRLVGSADIAMGIQRALSRAPVTTPEVVDAWKAAPVRQTYPAFGGLAMDPTGRIWVAEAPPSSRKTKRWVVFSADGRPVGRLELPTYSNTPLQPTPEPLAVGTDRVALLRRNRWGEYVIDVLAYEERP